MNSATAPSVASILDAEETIPLAPLPPPCTFSKYATEQLDKAGRPWDLSFTSSSISGLQSMVQAGIGLSVLPHSALRKGLRRASANIGLREMPTFSLALFTDTSREDEARGVFVGYLEAELEEL